MWSAKFCSQAQALRALASALTAKHDDADCIRHGGDSFVKILKCVS
jgi:GGDEF domain-containing protein